MLKTRVIAALIFAPALAALVYGGGLALGIACFIIAMLMMWEYLHMTLGQGEAYLKAVGFALAAVVVASALEWWPAATLSVLWPVTTVVLFLAVLLRPDPIDCSIRRAAFVALGVAYCAGLIPYLARLRALEQGLGFALMALFCTWGADTGAYFSGRLLGRRKLYPKISPSKTVEGVVGGLVASIGVAFLIRALFDMAVSPAHTALIGVIAGTFGVIGDLCESMLKRSVGAKDSSALIPGHGGVLDRFDAVMFVAPALYFYVVLLVQGQAGS